MLPRHARTVALVLDLRTGLVSPLPPNNSGKICKGKSTVTTKINTAASFSGHKLALSCCPLQKPKAKYVSLSNVLLQLILVMDVLEDLKAQRIISREQKTVEDNSGAYKMAKLP